MAAVNAALRHRKGDCITFLGTAGARFVMLKQLRASGGIWVSYRGTNVLIDPGPGSLLRCTRSRPKLDPSGLDAIILTHKHLDHSGDVNVMIEAMTEGGFKKRGIVFAPSDALDKDPVIFGYLKGFPEKIRRLKPRHGYEAGSLRFETSMRHRHPVETYGLKLKVSGITVGLLSDTQYFKELESFYRTDILVIAVVFLLPHPGVAHLCMDDVERIVTKARPKRVILTHFGMSMLKGGPRELCETLSRKTGIEVEAAYDGMSVPLCPIS